MAQLGIQTFIRVGTSGAIQDFIQEGDLIISEGAVRMDGTSEHYAPMPFPACADFSIVAALRQAAKQWDLNIIPALLAPRLPFIPVKNGMIPYPLCLSIAAR